MAKVACCRRLQSCELYLIEPTIQGYKHEFVLHLKSCECCGHQALEIIRIDNNDIVLKPERLKTRKIKAFLENMKVIWKPKKFRVPAAGSKFALMYNEYGVKKLCHQNLSNMRLGFIETDPLENLKYLKKNECLVWDESNWDESDLVESISEKMAKCRA